MVKISQSLMKAFYSIMEKDNEKDCPLFFEERYIKKNPLAETKPTDAMKEGIYFEYLCTGQLPRTGIVPTPEMTAKGELKEPYKRIKLAAEFFKEVIAYHEIEIIKTGSVLSNSISTGITDIEAMWNSVKCIIDIKYSGLIDDAWNKIGWDTGTLAEKHKLMIQGVHYKMLAQDDWGIDNIDFYYFVFNSKDPRDVKIIKQEIADINVIEKHRMDVDKVRDSIKTVLDKGGFRPIKDYRVCKDCPLFNTCEKATKMPSPIKITYSNY